jgi:hypothetical protein
MVQTHLTLRIPCLVLGVSTPTSIRLANSFPFSDSLFLSLHEEKVDHLGLSF